MIRILYVTFDASVPFEALLFIIIIFLASQFVEKLNVFTMGSLRQTVFTGHFRVATSPSPLVTSRCHSGTQAQGILPEQAKWRTF